MQGGITAVCEEFSWSFTRNDRVEKYLSVLRLNKQPETKGAGCKLACGRGLGGGAKGLAACHSEEPLATRNLALSRFQSEIPRGARNDTGWGRRRWRGKGRLWQGSPLGSRIQGPAKRACGRAEPSPTENKSDGPRPCRDKLRRPLQRPAVPACPRAGSVGRHSRSPFFQSLHRPIFQSFNLFKHPSRFANRGGGR